MAHKALNNADKAKHFLEKGLQKFNDPNHMGNGYLSYRIYSSDIEKALNKAE